MSKDQPGCPLATRSQRVQAAEQRWQRAEQQLYAEGLLPVRTLRPRGQAAIEVRLRELQGLGEEVGGE